MPRPGAFTELLAELARGPVCPGWDLPPRPGERVGRFEIVREIGRGGFGVVYEARDEELSRSVAFKAVRAGAATSGTRAAAEAEAAARLAHPNIVHLYDLGHCDRGAWLIMELLRGRSLAERIAEEPLPLREAVRVAVEVSRGLAHAHSQGVVHRDLKPSNVFLCDDGQVKVLDFGLAQVFGKVGASGGTPGYMAPELRAGEPGDERTDLYALGVVMRQLVPHGAPAALTRLIDRFTAQDPSARPVNGAEALAALIAFQKTLEPRTILRASVAVTVLAVIGAGGFAWTWQRPLPEGRLLTAMADTDNQTGDPDLDGVAELLRLGLDQTRRVSLMARSRLVNAIRAAGGAVPGRLGEVQARPAAVREHAALLLVPAILLSASGYELSVKALDLGRGATAFAVREGAGSKASIPAALDRLHARVRKALREEPGDLPKHPVAMADLAPAQPEALRLYTEARRLESLARRDEAWALDRRALEIDPGFLLARVALVDGPGFEFLTEAEQEAHQRVLRENLHRLPEKERAWVDGLARPWSGSTNITDEVLETERYLEAWPEDPRPYEWIGNRLLQQRGDLEAARPFIEKAVAIAGLTEGAAVDFLLALGRDDEALARARRWTEEKPTSYAFSNLHLAYQHRGEFKASIEAMRRVMNLEGKPPGRGYYAFLNLGRVEEAAAIYDRASPPHPQWLALRGRLREAIAAREALAPGRDASLGKRITFTFGGSFMLLARNDPEVTWRATRALFELGYSAVGCHALQLALVGDTERAYSLSMAGGHDGFICHRLNAAVRRWRRGDREGALNAFAGIWAPGSHLYRGQILAELGRHREAVEEIRRYRHERGLSIWDGNFDVWHYPRSLYFEAASLAALGERDEARRVLGVLQQLWDRADPDLPLVKQIQALERQLADEEGAGRRPTRPARAPARAP